jgi:hypothetical protein
MTSKARARFVLVCGVLGGTFVACSLDWKVRPDPGDGGGPETSRPDVIVGDTGVDAPGDAPDETSVDPDAGGCGALRADIAPAKASAKACALASGQCKATVNDECGCPVIVKMAGSAESTAYASAVATFTGKCGKPADCAACPALGLEATWACLQPGTPAPLCQP